MTKALSSMVVIMVMSIALITPIVSAEEPPEGWSEDIRLTYHEEGWDSRVRIASQDNTVHLVWRNTTLMGEEYRDIVSYRRSENSGWTWKNIVSLSEPGTLNGVDISLYGDYVYIVWDQWIDGAFEVFYRRSEDGGDTWLPEQMISSDDGYNSVAPKIAVSDDGMSIHVVWIDERHGDESWPPNTELYYNRSLDGGETWEGEVRLTDAPYYSAYQQIAVEGETVHVLWSDARYGVTSGDLFYKVSYDNGETWSDDFILADTSDSEISGAIAVDGKNIHVIWVRMVGSTYYLYYRNSTDNGVTWGPEELLWGPYDLVSNPDISVLGDEINVVWAGRIEEGEDTQIYFKESLDGGISWEDDLRLTNSVNNSWQPRVAMVDSMKHVVWSDLRHGNRELYYKRYPDFPSDVEQPEIYNVNVTDITKYSAVVEWTTDRPCDGTVRYSENSDLSNYQVVNESYLKLEHSFLLEDLTPNTTYYFEVSSADENGNTTIDDNDGEYYSFTTLDLPYPEIFNVSVSEVTEFTAIVEWSTDKPADSTVRYSENADLSDHSTVHSSELVVDHTVVLDELEHDTTYYFELQSTNEYERTTVDDNDGEYYSFTTLDLPYPEITDVDVIDITEFSAVVEWSTDRPSDSTVRYSVHPDLSDNETVHYSEVVTDHTVLLDDLTHDTTYYFEVSSTDEYGSNTTDDNDGQYYSFTTAAVPPPEIRDVTGDETYTGEEFSIEAEVSSLVSMSDVRVEYRFDSGTMNNVSMDKDEGVWRHVIDVPEDAVQLEYRIGVTDISGGSNHTALHTLDVIDIIPPVADAGDDGEIYAGETVVFNGSGSYDNVGVVEYSWQVGGENVELLGVGPSFTFNAPGEYTVALTVEDAYGNNDTDTMTVTVHPVEEGDEEKTSWLWWLLIIPIVLVIAFVWYRKRKEKDERSR